MPLTKVDAKINNIVNRVIKYGKKDKLQIIDRDTREVLADIKEWSFKRLNPAEKGQPSVEIRLSQNANTKDLLAQHLLAINGRIYDVIGRTAPTSVSDIEWYFKTSPTNSFVLE